MNGGGNFNELARIRAVPGFHITGGPPVRARLASAGPLSRVSASKNIQLSNIRAPWRGRLPPFADHPASPSDDENHSARKCLSPLAGHFLSHERAPETAPDDIALSTTAPL
jgi:hypothetical protein